ncbi:hypothetical protein RB195_002961 [Necator americanus]|uniref:ShKT domain-containing protein n=1 Tax=Necator americanus TaxID=51031 RepID=A0ABR1DM43_NECAM
MLLILISATLVCKTMCGNIVDLNCTYWDAAGAKAKFSEKAVNCPNVLPDSVCKALYNINDVVVDGDQARDEKCFKAADPSVKEAAIKTCPRTCGYCCLTPEYNCPNSQFPRISCSVITPNMCYSPAWKNIIEEDCPNVCGFCNSGNCFDVAPNCALDISICRSVLMQDFVKTVRDAKRARVARRNRTHRTKQHPDLHNLRPRTRILHLKSVPPHIRGKLRVRQQQRLVDWIRIV